MEILNRIKKYLIIAIPIILLIIFCFIYSSEEKQDVVAITTDEIKTTTTTKRETDNGFYIDIKGAVKKPGVYLVHENDKVIDAIKIAGGLTKTAVTSNINLSQKLKSEMVIYIFNKKELANPTTTKMVTSTTACKCETIKVDNCINPTTTVPVTTTTSSSEESITDGKININTASETELTKLTGIGEAKAKAIVEYRQNNGLFTTIEDIKNVSGLKDTIFEKIKDYITV